MLLCAALPARLRCVAPCSEQNDKVIFRRELIQANWPVT
jgi:hypothetical protein